MYISEILRVSAGRVNLRSSMNKEYRRLADLAFYTVMLTMVEGEKQHSDNTYMQKPIPEDIEHAIKHLRRYLKRGERVDLEHALTRCDIALMKDGIKDDTNG